MHIVDRYPWWPGVSDEDVRPMTLDQLRMKLLLDDFYMPRLEFLRWLVLHDRNPEYADVPRLAES